MKLELTRAERIGLAQIANVESKGLTLKEHILLEDLYRALKVDEIELPVPPMYLEDDKKNLFNKHEGKKLAEIEDEDEREALKQAIDRSRIDENILWSNQGGDEIEVDLTESMVNYINKFFETDERPFPDQMHTAIVSLYNKLVRSQEEN